MDIQEVSQAPSHSWKQGSANSVHLNSISSTYWLLVDANQLDHLELLDLQEYFFVVPSTSFDYFEFYFANDAEYDKEISPLVRNYTAQDKWIKKRGAPPAFKFSISSIQKSLNDKGENNTENNLYYFRMKLSSGFSFPVYIQTETALAQSKINNFITNFAYLVAIFCIILLSIFLYILHRDRFLIIYSIYLFCIALWFNSLYGDGVSYLWPQISEFLDVTSVFFMGAYISLSVLFACKILNITNEFPTIYKLARKITQICLIVSLLSFFPGLYRFVFNFLLITNLFYIPFFLIFSTVLFYRVKLHAQIFIGVWILQFAFSFTHVLFYLGVLSYHPAVVFGHLLLLPTDILFLFAYVWQKHKQYSFSETQSIKEVPKNKNLSKTLANNIFNDKLGSQFKPHKKRYQASSLVHVNLENLLSELSFQMNDKKIYMIEKLTLSDLAEELDINRTQLSELLNAQFNMNFSTYINIYRIEEVKKQLVLHPEKNILDIAYESGFGSKNAFSLEFKKITGFTAKEYRKANLQRIEDID